MSRPQVDVWSYSSLAEMYSKQNKNTLASSVEQSKITLKTGGEQVKTPPKTSEEDAKTKIISILTSDPLVSAQLLQDYPHKVANKASFLCSTKGLRDLKGGLRGGGVVGEGTVSSGCAKASGCHLLRSKRVGKTAAKTTKTTTTMDYRLISKELHSSWLDYSTSLFKEKFSTLTTPEQVIASFPLVSSGELLLEGAMIRVVKSPNSSLIGLGGGGPKGEIQ